VLIKRDKICVMFSVAVI